MGLLFGILLPAGILGLAVVIFAFARSTAWQIVALLLVAGPGLLLGGARVREAWIRRRIRERNSGRGYFRDRTLRALAAAIVRQDLPTISRLAPGTDLNRPGELGMTLVALAAEQAWNPDAAEGDVLAALQTLLASGARPGPALPTATRLKSPAVLAALLGAGADPNERAERGSPVVFEWIAVMPKDSLQLLAQRGLDPNLASADGTPFAVALAQQERWDLLALLLERGADRQRGDSSGRTVGQIVSERLAGAARDRRAPSAELLRVADALGLQDSRPVDRLTAG
jgi:hypothetical protein